MLWDRVASVIPFFKSLNDCDNVPITDTRMTRFMITLEQGVNLVWLALEDMFGGEIYVKKIPSMRITDLAEAVLPNRKYIEIGIRPGEKLHEQMIGLEDADTTYKYEGYFKILPTINGWSKDKKRIGIGAKVPTNFTYSSETNDEWMSKEELRNWLEDTYLDISYDD
jgi:FlaA1/EpsC-like NDP-sugar epimerase